jgi:hypothetical protein
MGLPSKSWIAHHDHEEADSVRIPTNRDIPTASCSISLPVLLASFLIVSVSLLFQGIF